MFPLIPFIFSYLFLGVNYCYCFGATSFEFDPVSPVSGAFNYFNIAFFYTSKNYLPLLPAALITWGNYE